MRRILALAVMSLAGVASPVAVAAPTHTAAAAQVRTQTKVQAEIHVLSIVTRSWPARRLHGLVNKQTHALATNTQAVCTGLGARKRGNRWAKFTCVIRPALHRRHEGLYVSYRVLATGGARVHWITYRSR